ncbi:MAG TPA: DUF5723 family protein [Sphingobacteriaceae bacterium]
MKKISLVCFLFVLSSFCSAQQYSLYNSRTLFDTFENSSQRAFQIDTSRRYAFNFFIPTISVNTTFTGPSQEAFRLLVFKSKVSSDVPFGGKDNVLAAHTNNYLLMFRLLKAVKGEKEMGFSWQLRNDTYIRASNETFAVFSDLDKFTEAGYSNIFNNKGYNQLYNQFSFSYRANYSRRMGLGAKLSFLNGLAYNKLRIDSSSLTFNETTDQAVLNLRGQYQSNFGQQEPEKKDFYPSLKNPGASITLSANYKFRDGWYAIGNIKDLGFIKWSKDSYEYNFNGTGTTNNPNSNRADDDLIEDLVDQIGDIESQGSFLSPTNAKAEILINKDFNNYQPNLILSKNLFYPGGDIAFINNYRYRNLVLTLSSAYNLNNFLQLGGQVMIKSPNFELYMGTDQFSQTRTAARNFINEETEGNGHTAASVYFGFAVKFGTVLEHQHNATRIPGFEEKGTRGGFIKRLFSKKK